MTTHQVYASKIAVSDDGSRTLKRTKKSRVNEKQNGTNYSVQTFFASRASIVALLFVVALNLQLHYKVYIYIFFTVKLLHESLVFEIQFYQKTYQLSDFIKNKNLPILPKLA